MSARRMSTPHLLVGGGHLSEFFTPAQWRTVRTMSLIIVLIWPPSRAATVIAGKAKSRCKSSDVLDCGLFLPRSCLPQTYPDRSWGLWFCWIYTSITCWTVAYLIVYSYVPHCCFLSNRWWGHIISWPDQISNNEWLNEWFWLLHTPYDCDLYTYEVFFKF